jgi:hypothetical protein
MRWVLSVRSSFSKGSALRGSYRLEKWSSQFIRSIWSVNCQHRCSEKRNSAISSRFHNERGPDPLAGSFLHQVSFAQIAAIRAAVPEIARTSQTA